MLPSLRIYNVWKQLKFLFWKELVRWKASFWLNVKFISAAQFLCYFRVLIIHQKLRSTARKHFTELFFYIFSVQTLQVALEVKDTDEKLLAMFIHQNKSIKFMENKTSIVWQRHWWQQQAEVCKDKFSLAMTEHPAGFTHKNIHHKQQTSSQLTVTTTIMCIMEYQHAIPSTKLLVLQVIIKKSKNIFLQQVYNIDFHENISS